MAIFDDETFKDHNESLYNPHSRHMEYHLLRHNEGLQDWRDEIVEVLVQTLSLVA